MRCKDKRDSRARCDIPRDAHKGRPDEADQPSVYARRISYITDPSTIRSMTLAMFGRAPTLEQCRRYRADYLADHASFAKRSEARTGGEPARQGAIIGRNAEIIAAYQTPMSMGAVADKFQIAERRVWEIINKAGVSRKSGPPPYVPKDPKRKKQYFKLVREIGAEEARKVMGLNHAQFPTRPTLAPANPVPIGNDRLTTEAAQ